MNCTSPWLCAECAADKAEWESDLMVMRAIVDAGFAAIKERDFEKAHGHEDEGHMLIVNRAAEGKNVRDLAEMLLPLCQDEYPRSPSA